MARKQLIKVLALMCFFNSSFVVADCSNKSELGNGDWQETVVSKEASLRLLEAEFLQALKDSTACQDSVSSRTAGNHGANNNGLPASPTGGASAALTENLADQAQTQTPASGPRGVISESYGDATRRRETSVAEANDTRTVRDETVSEEDNLKRVLREAIATEPNAEKRRALITRYESLFGPL
ncbi:hypothetical protein N9V47_06960 [Luminiphilus sp.]|nr:hypothetical protein [Luminiphilus sp.]MDB2377452.1 hypothetical protein [Luminiphilus sp.]